MYMELDWKTIDVTFPGLRDVWRRLKKMHEIRTRAPKRVVITDAPITSTPWHDSYVGRLHALDLETMHVSERALCTTYDVAPYVIDGAVGPTPMMKGNIACVKVEWNDQYRHVCLTIQVAVGRTLKCLEEHK